VLGGGGARGLAHIGVLKVLEREGLRPGLIVGTSMGAIVGGMYAQSPNAWLVEERVTRLIRSKPFRRIVLDAFSHEGAPDSLRTVSALYGRMKRGYGILKSVWSPGIVEAPVLIDFLSHLLDDVTFARCVIPFAAVTCDLLTGNEVICRAGPMLKAVAASSAIPGVVSPVRLGGKWLVDGGPTSMVPVDAALGISRLPVLAVTVTRTVKGKEKMTNAVDVVLRAGAIARLRLAEYNLRDAAVVLRPRVSSYGWADFNSIRRFVAEGERVAEHALESIRGL
jgi:NTE family protein